MTELNLIISDVSKNNFGTFTFDFLLKNSKQNSFITINL